MTSGIPTRARARKIDENAPPALRSTRSATTTTTITKPGMTSSTISSTAKRTASDMSGLASKIPKPVVTRTKSAVASTTTTATSSSTGARSRAALGDRTNAVKRDISGKDGKNGEKKVLSKDVVAVKEEKPVIKRKVTSASTSSSSSTVRPAVSRTTSRSTVASTSALTTIVDARLKQEIEKDTREPARKKRKTSSPALAEPVEETVDELDEGHYDVDGKEILLSSGGKPIGLKSPKRARAKDEGWEDLDAEDEGDPSMVSEYVVDAFNYMMRIEHLTMPNPDYMQDQTELQWKMRTILMDWLVEVHSKFRLLPETLFIAVNLIDRFLSKRVISLVKFQLVGLTALFIASKYEEIVCPSITHFLHMTDGGYSVEEILKAERYMLSSINFDLSYPNPIHFLRRISKADAYDIQVRTIAKFLVEISAVDHTLMPYPPSLLAAAAMYLARFCLERGSWNANLVHYSTYSVEELIEPAQSLLDWLLDPEVNTDSSFYKKYASKKHMKASHYMLSWATNRWPDSVLGKAEDVGCELYVEAGIAPPEHRLRAASNGTKTP